MSAPPAIEERGSGAEPQVRDGKGRPLSGPPGPASTGRPGRSGPVDVTRIPRPRMRASSSCRGTVEVPCLVDGSGVRPTRVGALPPQLAALNRAYLGMNELVVRAAVENEPRHIRHAAMVDPATSSALRVEQIWQLCDDMVLAHADRLQPGLRATLGS